MISCRVVVGVISCRGVIVVGVISSRGVVGAIWKTIHFLIVTRVLSSS